MFELARSPHGDHGSEDFLGGAPGSVRSRHADPRSPRARPARWCGTDVLRRTAPLSRTRRRCDEDRFATSEIVEHRGDAVGPLLQGRQRAGVDRIGRSRARLVEKDEPTQRCHRLNPPLNGRQLRKELAAGEPVRDEHDVARTFARRAIGDAQVPVHRIPRLREHGGSLSRAAGRVRCACDQPNKSVLHAFVCQSAIELLPDAGQPRVVSRFEDTTTSRRSGPATGNCSCSPMAPRCGRHRPGEPTPPIRGVEVTFPSGTPTPANSHDHRHHSRRRSAPTGV